MSLPSWQEKLANRGILGAALEAGWTPDREGWRYPVPGNGVRWKAWDSAASPKYLWVTGAVSTCPYYHVDNFADVVQAASGEIILASGEPDALVLRSAGVKNVLSWFGEKNIPVTLGADLRKFGVRVVESYPDLDDTGMGATSKLAQHLSDAGITFRAYHLPAADNSKYDLNKLWIDCAFNAEKFWQELLACEQMVISAVPRQLPLDKHHDDLPEGFYAAIEQRLGVTGYKHDGWSKPVPCVLKQHEHDNTAPAATWHKDKRVYRCFKCMELNEKAMLAVELGEHMGIDWHDFLPIRTAKPLPVAPTKRTQAVGQPRIVYGWSETTDEFIKRLTGDADSGPDALPLRWRNLRKFGGYADLMDAGKLMAVVGDSGDGKTSLIETQLDEWRRAGYSGILFGPEWSRSQYVMRAVQRRGGPALAAFRKHDTWKRLNARGTPDKQNYGERLTDEQLEFSVALAKEVNAWPGHLWFIERMGLPIEKALVEMAVLLDQRQAEGEHISYVAFDYVQLMDTTAGREESERVKRVLAAIKTFCVDRQLIGIVGSQVTKGDGRAAAAGAKNTSHSMQYARSDVFNLVVTLSREVVNGEKSNKATMTVSKNSLGKTGQDSLYLNTGRMAWFDTAD